MGKTNVNSSDTTVVSANNEGTKKKPSKSRQDHKLSSGIPTARALIKHLHSLPFDGPALDAFGRLSDAVKKATGLEMPWIPNQKEFVDFRTKRKEHKAKYAAKSKQMRTNALFLSRKNGTDSSNIDKRQFEASR
jgi:hypothetical protein